MLRRRGRALLSPDNPAAVFVAAVCVIALAVAGCGRDDFNNPRNFGLDKGKVYGQTFIHEMTHVWQLHNTRMGLTWITDALVSQVLNSLGDSAYTYQPGSAYGDYNLEQQAKIVEDWFAGGMDPNSMLYRYIEGNIRLGNPG